ncbi:MAG: glycerol-3-phosphate dehydrogenase/oxidase, partial [Verrucomicrobiae bacterium]|nr:glycerol-3-phosphate dehydrogenase/oxidase [Verrucomicrobiae bacterium]
MNRAKGLKRLKSEKAPWDVLIIGGGSTGLGCALDAVSRGYRTLLIEQADFSNATSSRSTKLIHGGVRYLRQGNISLVRESLAERGWLLKHLPHLVQPQPFLIPTYSFWETWFYRIGLWMYDRLAGALRIHASKRCNRQQALERVPTLKADKLYGGVVYWDGQFDDARMCVELANTVWSKGGLALNYLRANTLIKEAGKVVGVEAMDVLSGEQFVLRGRAIIHATGIFSDRFRREDHPGVKPMIRSSRGSHLVVDGSCLPGGNAIMVPKTSDGRLLFMVPWLDRVIVGTTDIPDENLCLEPRATKEEIDFIIENATPYLSKPITRGDVLSVYSGLRPLVMDPKKQGNTSALSRDHVIDVSESGLITIAGGKWTTFRKMGEDAINQAMVVSSLPERYSRSRTMGFSKGKDSGKLDSWIVENPSLREPFHSRLPYTWADVLWAVREELAVSVADVLARRTRALLLDAQAAIEAAPEVAAFMARELGLEEAWAHSSVESFLEIAKSYTI